MTIRLPDEANMRLTPKIRKRLAQDRLWTNDTELLAQLIEVISVQASEMRLKEPITIPRPSWLRSGQAPNARNPYAAAIGMLRGSARTVRT